MIFPKHTYTLWFLFGMPDVSASLCLIFGAMIKQVLNTSPTVTVALITETATKGLTGGECLEHGKPRQRDDSYSGWDTVGLNETG